MTLEEFCDKHLSRHDALAFRALDGDALSPEESEELARLSDVLCKLLPPSTPLPADVIEAMAEVRRLLGKKP